MEPGKGLPAQVHEALKRCQRQDQTFSAISAYISGEGVSYPLVWSLANTLREGNKSVAGVLQSSDSLGKDDLANYIPLNQQRWFDRGRSNTHAACWWTSWLRARMELGWEAILAL